MKHLLLALFCMAGSLLTSLQAQQSEVFNKHLRTLTARVNGDWSRPPVADMEKEDRILIEFDELTREYHRFEYVIRHCNADWKPSALNEIDYLRGFNNNKIEQYDPSMNTLMEYTHYRLQIPNEQVQITQSGNYEVLIFHEDNSETPAAIARFALADNKIRIAAQVSSNTDIDLNQTHQQVSFAVQYNGLNIRNPQDELKVVVRQNNRPDNQVTGLTPTSITGNGVRYDHNRSLIFDAGNEYRRFEMLSYYHHGMGIERIERFDAYYHATLYLDRPRVNYIYDRDQNGAFIIRNDETNYSDIEADYMLVHFALDTGGEPVSGGEIYLQGEFTRNNFTPEYRMKFNPESGFYENTQLMKQGLYNYQYIFKPENGKKTATQLTEGNFYETENDYQIYVYYRPFAARADQLIGFLPLKYTP